MHRRPPEEKHHYVVATRVVVVPEVVQDLLGAVGVEVDVPAFSTVRESRRVQLFGESVADRLDVDPEPKCLANSAELLL